MRFPLRSAFLALPLEGDALRHFRQLQRSLEPWADILRFQNPLSPHLTLYFWPELLEIEYAPLLAKAAQIAAATSPFVLDLTGTGTFGARGEDRVLFLDVAFSPELAAVKKRCPWPNPPDKPFTPHITLARIRHPQRFGVAKKKILKALGDPSMTIIFERLGFYAEIDGRKQTPLEDWPLGSA